MFDVCNIFNPLNKETGNFLIFSQYTNDLSISTVNDKYKVRPSRFMCLDLAPEVLANLKPIENPKTGDTDINYSLPGFFQNQFENGISEARSNGLDIAGHNFSVVFWTELMKLTETNDDTLTNLPRYIKYIGNINMESWHNGFADILVDIISGSTKYNVSINTDIIKDTTLEYFLDNCGRWKYEADGYISGWTVDSGIPISGVVGDNDIPVDTYICIGKTNETPNAIYDDNNIPFFDNVFKYKEVEIDSESDDDDKKFTFNTIILTYDIIDESGNATWKDIPMGIYFTGLVSAGESTIGNPVTIYSSKEEAYGAGSAWSLRICTRFSPTPHHTLKVEEVAIESGVMDDSLSALMSANAEVINTLNTFTNALAGPDGLNSTIRDTYSIFKNSKINVPTIKTINDKQYWFVNGRNVGPVEAIPMEWDTD